ncbi:hypothetical protein Tco_1121736 [Tanacetum coccineum]|uniref:DUF4283 domain-containing protein n=1 Tax=Tanacetum coccineum TaxID=301880 RepID=A0ABQ5IYJ6_9ASTR
MCLDKTEPETIPLWIKIGSVPLEAWTIKGISVLWLVRNGNPMVMYNVTGNQIKKGVGRLGFAIGASEANKEREDKEVNQSNGNLKNGTEKNDNEGLIPVPEHETECNDMGKV